MLSSYAALKDCPSSVSEFLSTYDDALSEDPVEAIRVAHSLLASLPASAISSSLPRTSGFFPALVSTYFTALSTTLPVCQCVVELFTELLSQFTTRRYLLVFLKDAALLPRSRCAHVASAVFAQQLCRLEEVADTEVDEWSGAVLTEEQAAQRYYRKVLVLQRVLFKWASGEAVRRRYYRGELEELCMASVQQLGDRAFLAQHLSKLESGQLRDLAVHLRLVPPVTNQPTTSQPTTSQPTTSQPTTSQPTMQPTPTYSPELLTEIITTEYARPHSTLDAINALPLLPTETRLWRDAEASPLLLPTLNLQYLSYGDFFQRNFLLYQAEAYGQVRTELGEAIHAMRCRLDLQGDTVFAGQSRMGVAIHSFRLTEVRQAQVGEALPAEVRGEILFSLHGLKGETRKEWEALREHDVVFVALVEGRVRDDEYEYGAKKESGREGEKDDAVAQGSAFLAEEGVVTLRGCEVVAMEDEEGVRLNDLAHPDTRLKRAGKLRKLTVRFDPRQYQLDMEEEARQPQRRRYETFNLLLRRDPAKNNFKAVLETTRALLNEPTARLPLPHWLWNVLLGRGNPAAAHYSALAQSSTVDFGDTFEDAAHVRASFPQMTVRFQSKSGATVETLAPPYKLTFEEDEIVCSPSAGGRREEYEPFSLHPATRRAGVRFTPTQVEAIRSGLQEGLTVIEGPPGTGKTDVAVQLIATLYRSHPEQRVLFVARSNHALNDLFEKIASRAVAKRHLLRLGQGERELELQQDFTRLGRIDFCLRRCQTLLEEVRRLAVSLGAAEDVAYSCETAGFFEQSAVRPRLEALERVLAGEASEAEKAQCRALHANASEEQKAQAARWAALNDSELGALFPFKLFFLGEEPLFPRDLSEAAQAERARGCAASLRELFAELKEYRAFELLRTNRHRTEFVLAQEARVVAMTCTHAALMRQQLAASGLKVDTVIVEEAGQILELETLIPLLLQVGVMEAGKA